MEAIFRSQRARSLPGRWCLRRQWTAHLGSARPGDVQAVISYNYDNLLETVLAPDHYQAIWKEERLERGKLPIYHVHGFVPHESPGGASGSTHGAGSLEEEIVFTEEQYHRAADDAYAWYNLVQLQTMSANAGLMIGLSVSDRNIRRLLGAVMKTPLQTRNFALLKKPQLSRPDPTELDEINNQALEYADKFAKSGAKARAINMEKGPDWQRQITGILNAVEDRSVGEEERVLEQLGVVPIWVQDHSDIENILLEIAS